MSYNSYEGFETVSIQNFDLVDWSDRIDLLIPVSKKFTHIHVRRVFFKTDTTGLRTLSIRFKNLDCNIQVHQNQEGNQAHETCIDTFLPSQANADLYYENAYPPIELLTGAKGKLTQLEYEIYVDNVEAYAGITSMNPVFIQVAFLMRK